MGDGRHRHNVVAQDLRPCEVTVKIMFRESEKKMGKAGASARYVAEYRDTVALHPYLKVPQFWRAQQWQEIIVAGSVCGDMEPLEVR